MEDRAAIAGQDAELPEMRRRARWFGVMVVLAFLGLAARLFYLQVVHLRGRDGFDKVVVDRNGIKQTGVALADLIDGDPISPQMRREVSASPESLALVRQALVGVVNDLKGTAFRARISGVVVAGKTGTAQVTRLRRRGEAQSAGGDENDHPWFAGYAPADKPRIAFAVLVEHGGFGGEVAAPIATEIVRGYFNEIEPSDRDGIPLGVPRSPKAPITVPAKAHPLRGEKMDRKASLPTDHGEAIGRRHILINAPPTILGSP